jgi:hypothetical protein
MPWEQRGGRGRYYTRKRTVNGRIVREYVGTGAKGEEAAAADRAERAERLQDQAALRADLEQYGSIEDQHTTWSEFVQQLAYATLIVAGYHRHSTWRKRREISTNEGEADDGEDLPSGDEGTSGSGPAG